MTPNEIEVLIFCHVSPVKHPRIEAPAVRKALVMLEKHGMIKRVEFSSYQTTKRGNAHIETLCQTPWPFKEYIDHFKEIGEE